VVAGFNTAGFLSSGRTRPGCLAARKYWLEPAVLVMADSPGLMPWYYKTVPTEKGTRIGPD